LIANKRKAVRDNMPEDSKANECLVREAKEFFFRCINMCLNCSVVVVLWHKSEIKLIRRSKGCLIVQWDRERSIECQQCGDHGSQNYKSVGFQTVKKLSKPCAVVTSFGLKND
jgi:hypothetical protein